MSDINLARRKFRIKLSDKQNKSDAIPALLGLGNGTVTVPNQAGMVYIRVGNEENYGTAFNNRVSPRDNLPVFVGYDPITDPDRRLFQVLSIRQSAYTDAGNVPIPAVGPHHETHEYGGGDDVFVEWRRILGLRVGRPALFVVTVDPGYIYRAGTWILAPVGANTVDLTAEHAALVGSQAQLILISLDSTGVIVHTPGTIRASPAVLTISDCPTPPAGNIPLAAVRIYATQTAIGDTPSAPDIIDLRFPTYTSMNNGGVAGNDTEVQYNDAGVFGADSNLTWKVAPQRLEIGGPRTVVSASTSGVNILSDDIAISPEVDIWAIGDGISPIVYGRRAISGLLPPTTGLGLLSMLGSGYDGATWLTNMASIRLLTNEDWGVGANGTRQEFWTTPNGSAITAVSATIDSASGIKNNATNLYSTKDHVLTAAKTGTLPVGTGAVGHVAFWQDANQIEGYAPNPALNLILPSQVGQSGNVLSTDGANTSWVPNTGGGGGGAGSGNFEPSLISDVAFIARELMSITSDWVEMFGSLIHTYDTGIRFMNVAVPNGAVITRAYITLTGYASNGTDTVTVELSGESGAAPAAFSTYADFIGRSLTAARVAWTPVPHTLENVLYQTPDVTSIVQEIVDLVGWVSGNNLVIFIKDNGSTLNKFRQYGTEVPVLHIEYALPGHVIQDEGVSLTRRTRLNFVGGGVAATDDAGNDASLVTIPNDMITAHAYTGGAALDVFGLSGANTIALLTPSSSPGAASAILKSDAAGGLGLTGLDLTEVAAPATPAANVLRLYVEDFHGFSQYNFVDDTGMVRKIVRDSVFIARAAENILIGDAVYVFSQAGNVPEVKKAKSDNLATMPAIGIATETAVANAYLRVMQVGLMENFDTSLFVLKDTLYVSATTAGLLTSTAPLYPNIRQEMGAVLVVGVGNGAMQVIARSMFNEGILDHGGLLGLIDDDHTQYVLGTGVIGQVAEFVTSTRTLQAAKLIGPAVNILTLTATEASTLGLAINEGKALTLTAVDNYNLTVPATGTSVLLDYDNVGEIRSNYMLRALSSSHLVPADSTACVEVAYYGSADYGFIYSRALNTAKELRIWGDTVVFASSAVDLGYIGFDTKSCTGGILYLKPAASMSASNTITFPNLTGTVALGAGTLTSSTVNSVTIADHTHAITGAAWLASANAFTLNQSILSSTVPQFTVGYDASSYMTISVADATGVVTFNAVKDGPLVGSFVFTPAVTFTAAPICSTLTAGRVVFAGASKELVDSSTFKYSSTGANGLSVNRTVSDPAATQFNVYSQFNVSDTLDNANTLINMFPISLISVSSTKTHSGQITGVVSDSRISGAGAVTGGVYGFCSLIRADTVALSDARKFYAQSPVIANAGTIVAAYGLYIDAMKVTGVTTGYGVYQAGASDINYFAGNVGIGKNTSIDHPLDVLGGINTDNHYHVADTQVVGARGAAVADATDAASAISRLNELLARCRAHGLIAT